MPFMPAGAGKPFRSSAGSSCYRVYVRGEHAFAPVITAQNAREAEAKARHLAKQKPRGWEPTDVTEVIATLKCPRGTHIARPHDSGGRFAERAAA